MQHIQGYFKAINQLNTRQLGINITEKVLGQGARTVRAKDCSIITASSC